MENIKHRMQKAKWEKYTSNAADFYVVNGSNHAP